MLTPLRERNYRLFTTGQVVSVTGTWMQRIAQDWFVLQLSGGNASTVGIVVALQFIPTVILSVWGGLLADRHDKRRLLIGTQLMMAICALAFAVLDLTGTAALWQIYILSFALGCICAVDSPTRQAFTAEMVGKPHLQGALSLNLILNNLARVIGPAAAGLMITAAGTGWVSLLNALSFAVVLAGLIRMNPEALHRSRAAAHGQLRDALRYVRSQPTLPPLLITVFLTSTFAMVFPVSLTALTCNTYGLGAQAYGLLSTALAIGTVLGATLASKTGKTPQIRSVWKLAATFGICETTVAVMPTFTLAAIMLIPTGALMLAFTTACLNLLHRTIADDMRGRVMGLYLVCSLGGWPLGSLCAGWLADHLDPTAPLIAGGIITILTATIAALHSTRITHTTAGQRIMRLPLGSGHPISSATDSVDNAISRCSNSTGVR